MDQFILEIVLNEGYLDFYEAEPTEFSIGGSVDLTNQVSEAVQGYVELNKLEDAVPSSITITSLPGCGVLYRQSAVEGEGSFAVLWTYDVEEGFAVEAAVGDTVNFAFESIFYEADPTCEEMQYEFTYAVMATIPVEGPPTSLAL